jgi:hypothetical protein
MLTRAPRWEHFVALRAPFGKPTEVSPVDDESVDRRGCGEVIEAVPEGFTPCSGALKNQHR